MRLLFVLTAPIFKIKDRFSIQIVDTAEKNLKLIPKSLKVDSQVSEN